MEKEIEAKYFINDKDTIRKNLQELGLTLKRPEFMMKRKTFHSKTEGGWIRVRNEGDKITMTFKEVVGNSINDVNEIEIIVNDFDRASAILNQTSFKEASYQENYREIWVGNDVEIVIDTWPYLQNYIEIEAKNEETVRKYSSKLGLDFDKDAHFGGVDILYSIQYRIPHRDFVEIDRITFGNEGLKKTLESYI